MYNLETFYRSREWRSLLENLKLERVDDKGQIICEYCQKPITRAYDVIGHHKEHLTEENVNDFNISLNPDNISFVHHRCHNFIHNKLGYSGRQVFVVYGAPLSGKTTWVKNNMSEGDMVVDMDSIWQCISGCDRYIKPNRLKAVAFKVRDSLIDSIKYRYGKWRNAYVIGGYPYQSERERLCKELGAREIFIDVSKDECIDRLQASEDRNQDEWRKYIYEWFERYTPPMT